MQLKKRELVGSLPRTCDRLSSKAGSFAVTPFKRSWVISTTGMFECADLLLCSINLDAALVLHHTCIMKGVVQPDNWERGVFFHADRGWRLGSRATWSLSILPSTTLLHKIIRTKQKPCVLQLLVPHVKKCCLRDLRCRYTGCASLRLSRDDRSLLFTKLAQTTLLGEA